MAKESFAYDFLIMFILNLQPPFDQWSLR